MLKGIKDVDLSKIRELEAKADWKGVRHEWAQLSNIFSDLSGLDHVKDGLAAARKFGYQATMDADAAIKRTMERVTSGLCSKSMDELTDDELNFVVSKMEFEADWIEKNGTHRETWVLARDAYKDKALEAKAEKETRRIKALLNNIGQYTSFVTTARI